MTVPAKKPPTKDQAEIAALKLMLAEWQVTISAAVAAGNKDIADVHKQTVIIKTLIAETELAAKGGPMMIDMLNKTAAAYGLPLRVAEPQASIRKFLDLNTRHLHPNTMTALSACSSGLKGIFDSLIVDAHGKAGEYGYWLYVPEELPNHLSVDLIAVIEAAKKRGCDWICIDRDAEVITTLPTYDIEWLGLEGSVKLSAQK